MRVVKAVDWRLVGYNSYGFVFENAKFADEFMIVKEAKYVIAKDVVLFMTLDKQPIVVPSRSTKQSSLSSVQDLLQSVLSASQSIITIA